MVLHTTSGTTGAPQPLLFGARDREIQNALLARAYIMQGLRADDVVQSLYGFGLVNGGHYVREAILHFTKALLLPAGTGHDTPSERQVRLMRDFGVTALVGFADYIKKLAQVRDQLGFDLEIRLISGHLGQENRRELADLWPGAQIYDWYGVGDTGIVAAEGPRQNGLHIWEDAHLVEILNPASGQPAPDGNEGDICVTSLFKTDVYPIVRFNTKDVSAILPPAPASGLGFRRLAGFQGRSDNMVKLRGVNVYPTAIGGMLSAHSALTGEYVCEWIRRDGREDLRILVECHQADLANMRDQVAGSLRQRLGVSVEVELVAPGGTAALTEIERRQKPIRLIDRRKEQS